MGQEEREGDIGTDTGRCVIQGILVFAERCHSCVVGSSSGSRSLPRNTTWPLRSNSGGIRGLTSLRCRLSFSLQTGTGGFEDCGLTSIADGSSEPACLEAGAPSVVAVPSDGGTSGSSTGGAGMRREVLQVKHVYTTTCPCDRIAVVEPRVSLVSTWLAQVHTMNAHGSCRAW